MPFVPTAGAVRVDIQFQASGQQVHNIIWCSRTAAWTETERTDLADAIVTWWDTTAKSLFNGNIALTQVTVVNQDTQNAPSSTRIVAPAIAGTLAGNLVPEGTALCATLRTNLRGRSYRGRMYLGGLDGTALLNRLQVTTTFIGNLITALTALKTAISGLGALWVVVSHFANGSARSSGVKTEITAIAIDSYLDSQRRRLGLRGV